MDRLGANFAGTSKKTLRDRKYINNAFLPSGAKVGMQRGGVLKKYVFKIMFSIFCMLRFLNEAGATGRLPGN